jgi:regulator of protease activity HflC (stomatin/prohibitin superfamily)
MSGAVMVAAPREGHWAQSARLAFRFLYALVGLLALGWLGSNIRQVPPDSRAVVLRLGQVVGEQGAGLLLAWPRPIEEVRLLPAPDRQIAFRIARFDVGLPGESAPADIPLATDPRGNEGFLLTGDSGVVHLQATLLYQITDPVSYLITGDHLGPALERLFVASAVVVASGRDIDTMLVARPEKEGQAAQGARAGREQLRADLVRAVNQRLRQLADQGAGLGVTVSRIDLVVALPGAAKAAFDQVLTVTQAADEAIARARTYAETKKQEAQQERDRVIAEARASAEELRAQAQSRTAAIAALTGEAAAQTGQALIDRLYYERIAALLKKARKVDTFDPASGVKLIIPGTSSP